MKTPRRINRQRLFTFLLVFIIGLIAIFIDPTASPLSQGDKVIFQNDTAVVESTGWYKTDIILKDDQNRIYMLNVRTNLLKKVK